MEATADVATDEGTPKWPLSYKIQPPKAALSSTGFGSKGRPVKRWWSHMLYRGPNNEHVEIQYSKTRERSEVLAQQFLNEPVVGFDMEWPWNDWKRKDLQNKIGLIQVATESKIALFHIGLHLGMTVEDIIAPSLRRLIEDPKIGKLGVSILNSDFTRLYRFFGLKPQGAVELSHLYRLVKYGQTRPEWVSNKLVSLAQQVQDQLGYPLYKGNVRTSNWSKPLSQDQINYAAGDAYAALMLYHCMNMKRAQMKPRPPLPVYAENMHTYKISKLRGLGPITLVGQTADGKPLTSEIFFGISASLEATRTKKRGAKSKPTKSVLTRSIPPKPELESIAKALDPVDEALYQALLQRRATLASEAGLPDYRVISEVSLKALARKRPVDALQLLSVKGIGKIQQERYGAAWLEVISRHALTIGAHVVAVAKNPDTPPPISRTPIRTRAGRMAASQTSPASSDAFGTPAASRSRQLHTDSSFTTGETTLISHEERADDIDSDGSLASLDFGTPPLIPSPLLKRKRTPSIHDSGDTASSTAGYTTQQQEVIAIKPVRKPPQDAINPKTRSRYPTTPVQLSPRSKISRNKLLAFSKLVTRKLPDRSADAPAIVSGRTLDLIVWAAQNSEDLEAIPGIQALVQACQMTNTDLLKNVMKFTSVRAADT